MDEEDKRRLEYLEQRAKRRDELVDKIIIFVIATAIGIITLILWYQSSTGN